MLTRTSCLRSASNRTIWDGENYSAESPEVVADAGCVWRASANSIYVQVKAGGSASAAASALAQAVGTAVANSTSAAFGQVAVQGALSGPMSTGCAE